MVLKTAVRIKPALGLEVKGEYVRLTGLHVSRQVGAVTAEVFFGNCRDFKKRAGF